MQFFEGTFRFSSISYSSKEKLHNYIRELNTKYWVDCKSKIHISISKITTGNATIIAMNEDNSVTGQYIEDLSDIARMNELSENVENIVFNEISLSTFENRMREEWFDQLFDDKDAIWEKVHVDGKQYICKERLLEPLSVEKTFNRRYIPKIELDRIRVNNCKSDFTEMPVHYLVIEKTREIQNRINEEIVYELRKAGRISCNRYITISADNYSDLERYNGKIQNLNNLDGGIVIVRLDCLIEGHSIELVRAIYSEQNNYTGKYTVIFNVPEDKKELVNEVKRVCKLWPFVTIENRKLNKKEAITHIKEIASENGVSLSNEECKKILGEIKCCTHDEVNELYRGWYLNTYNIDLNYPQYRKMVDDYYSLNVENRDALNELNSLVGLNSVKDLCKKIINYYELQKLRNRENFGEDSIGMHMVFSGNPGTAKTTVARLVARIMKQKGILSKGDLIEVGRADLVGKYVGWTAKTVQEYFEKAKGSILFIDEAYSLIDDNNSFGAEAINTIVQEMENNREDVVVIFAGYGREMRDFIDQNSGLKSRISFFVDFPDYSNQELYQILELFARKNHYELDNDVYPQFMGALTDIEVKRGNGRYVRNIFEGAKLRQAERLMKLPKKQRVKGLYTLIGEDFGDQQK